MGYYVRVLGTSDPDIHIDDLIKALEVEKLQAAFSLDENESGAKWTVFLLSNMKGDPIMQVERNPVIKGELGYDELEEFREEVSDCQPASAAEWLGAYFDKIKVIYACQLLGIDTSDKYWRIVTTVKEAIWNKTGGILQADQEGFTNEDGFHILWQFTDDVAGKYHCAVLEQGKWKDFSMNLGNSKQRRQFLEGKVPSKSFW